MTGISGLSKCKKCSGSGREPGSGEPCSKCGGGGYLAGPCCPDEEPCSIPAEDHAGGEGCWDGPGGKM